MFQEKRNSLFDVPVKKQQKQRTSTNGFVEANLKKAAETKSGNGALKYSTTGNDLVDQFGKLGEYKQPRKFDAISKDMSLSWAANPRLAICFVLFIRTITRVVQFFSGERTETAQRGAGLKHEGIFRMIWIHIHHTETFWKNINLFISVGSWKDIFTMLQYDLEYNGWKDRKLDWDKFGQLILAGLENPNTNNLIKKYLPQIKSKSACTSIQSQADNIIGKWICSLLFGTKGEDDKGKTYKQYRKLKTSGNAHEWQKLISQNKLIELNFDTIHGRALAQLVSSKFIKNNNLEQRYQEWIAKKPVAKFTGFVCELFQKGIPNEKYQVDTLNAQFNGLVETAKKGAKTDTSLIVVRDTSGSMSSNVVGINMRAYDVAKSLALFFSEMLPDGHFANSWIEFNSTAIMHTWKGSTAVEKWRNDSSSYVGTTNFQSVIDLFVSTKKRGIPEHDFPSGILCISDGEFNPASQLNKTNVHEALSKLKNAGFSSEYVDKFVIILWNLPTRAYDNKAGRKFETYGDTPNVYYLSGYDGSTIAFLTGVEGQENVPTNARELFEAAMNQEVLNMVEV